MSAAPTLVQGFAAVVRRDLLLAFKRPGDVLNPLVFFAIVSTLFPLAIGPASEVSPVPVSNKARHEPITAVGRVQKMTIGEANDSNREARIMYTRIAAIPIIQ